MIFVSVVFLKHNLTNQILITFNFNTAFFTTLIDNNTNCYTNIKKY